MRFCPKDIAVMSILLLSWCDTAASTFGRLWGHLTPRVRKGKSLAGSIAACVTGVITAVVWWGWLGPLYSEYNHGEHAFAFQGALTLPKCGRLSPCPRNKLLSLDTGLWAPCPWRLASLPVLAKRLTSLVGTTISPSPCFAEPGYGAFSGSSDDPSFSICMILRFVAFSALLIQSISLWINDTLDTGPRGGIASVMVRRRHGRLDRWRRKGIGPVDLILNQYTYKQIIIFLAITKLLW